MTQSEVTSLAIAVSLALLVVIVAAALNERPAGKCYGLLTTPYIHAATRPSAYGDLSDAYIRFDGAP